MFVGALPGITFVWVYATVLLGLDRVGRVRLNLEPYEGDRYLGLRPLGALAFTGFLIFVAMALPILVYGSTDLRTGVGNVIVFLAGVVFFFLSLHRLHVQLVSAKAEYLARVRRLYAEALAQAEWSLESLASRSPQLNAAETLERAFQRSGSGRSMMPSPPG